MKRKLFLIGSLAFIGMLPLTACNKSESFEGTYEAYSIVSNGKELTCPVTAEAWGSSLEGTGITEICSSKYVFENGLATMTAQYGTTTVTRTAVYRFDDNTLYMVEEEDDNESWKKVATYKDGVLKFAATSGQNEFVYKKK